MHPKLRAEAIVWRNHQDQIQFLVQCDDHESFYRFPGGTVEFAESTAAALTREFNEEYGLTNVAVGNLKIVSEERVTYQGTTHHRVTLMHEAQILSNTDQEIRHKEYTHIKMVWRSLEAMATKDVVPSGILEHLRYFHNIASVHLTNGFSEHHLPA